MIGDNLGQIGRFCPLGNDRRRVRDVLEQRTIREECAARDEDDARLGLAIADEIGCRDRASVLQHNVQDHDFRCLLAEEIDRVILAGHHEHRMVLSFQMPCPDLC